MDTIIIPDGLLWIVLGISVLVQFLREFSAIEPYKRFLPYLCIALGAAAVWLFGGLPLADCIQLGVAIGLMAAGGYDALAAFAKKTEALPDNPSSIVPPQSSLIALIAVGLLFVGGCAAPLFTPIQRLRLDQAVVIVEEFDSRCQAGDDQACRDGLAKAAQTLRILATDDQ